MLRKNLFKNFPLFQSLIDEEGKLKEDFGYPHSVSALINEPPPTASLNCAFAFNDKTQNLEVWTIKEIQSGEELYLYYGKGFGRHYTLNEELQDVHNISLVIAPNGLPCCLDLNGNQFFIFANQHPQSQNEILKLEQYLTENNLSLLLPCLPKLC